MRIAIIVSLALLVCPTALGAGTYYIDPSNGNDQYDGLCRDWDGGTCGPKATLAGALALAQDGDEVLLADGIYVGTRNREQTVRRSILIRSESGDPINCILDPERSGRALSFELSGKTARLEGIGLQNGTGDPGSAVRLRSGRLEVRKCRFQRNRGRIAALYAEQGTQLFVSGCRFHGNEATTSGGALSIYSDEALIERCEFRENSADSGGAAAVFGKQIVMRACHFIQNSARRDGGALMLNSTSNSDIRIADSVFIGNRAEQAGGAIATYLCTRVTLQNLTVTDNWSVLGGACNLSRDANDLIVNCLMVGNDAIRGPQLMTRNNPTVRVQRSLIEGGRAGVAVEGKAELTWGTDNLDVDPRFAIAGDYHLAPDSPCIDAGTADFDPGPSDTDSDGNPRIEDGDSDGVSNADIGAHEFAPARPGLALDERRAAVETSTFDDTPVRVVRRLASSGGVSTRWRITKNVDWLTVEPSEGELRDDAIELSLIADPTDLGRGDYEGRLRIEADDAVRSEIEIPVTLRMYDEHRVGDDDQKTIQAALNIAQSYDTVWLPDGVYLGEGNRNLNFRGRAIRLRSEHGPANCVIDAEGAARVASIDSSSGAVLDGLTLRGRQRLARRWAFRGRCVGAGGQLRFRGQPGVGIRRGDLRCATGDPQLHLPAESQSERRRWRALPAPRHCLDGPRLPFREQPREGPGRRILLL